MYEDGYYLKEFNELTGKDEHNEKLLMQGVIMGIGEIEHYPIMAAITCNNCKNDDLIHSSDCKDWRSFNIPKTCEKCGGVFTITQLDKSTIRKFLFSEEKNSNPITMTGFVFGDMVYQLRPGESIRVNGVIHSVKMPKHGTYQRVLDINRMTLTNTKVKLPTDLEIQEFKDMDKDKLIQSFAPRIKNMKLIKEGLLIGLLGGVDDGYVRGDINVLLMGDPGVAKTQLLKFITTVIQKSDYTSGKSSSQAGLLAGVDNLSDGTRIAKPGSVIMCNGGVCCIDEFEKMNPIDRAGLHEVMENRTYSLRKVGINMTWEAKTIIFAAANPRSSRWDMALSIKENVNLPDSLISRFGLIFLIRDIPDQENDLEIARHIRKIKQHNMEDYLSAEIITKFINYARTINPIILDETADCLEKYWSELRCQGQPTDSILIDNRTLQDLYRMAEAYARMNLSNTVTEQHAQYAIKLLTNSLQTMGMNTPGQVTQSMMRHLSKDEFIMGLFKNGISEKSAIIKMCEHGFWFNSEEKALREISKLSKNGLIYDNGGVWKWV